MMDQVQIFEAHGGPAERISLYFIYRVPSRCGPEAPNPFPAAAPIYLGCTPYVKGWRLLKFFSTINQITDSSTADTKPRVVAKVAKAGFEVIGLEGQVAIELNYVIPVRCLQLQIGLVEGFDHAPPRFSKSSIVSMD